MNSIRTVLWLWPALVGGASAAPLRVVGTFSVISDLVASVGGSRVQVTNLVPRDGDAHTYQPSTGDIRAVAGAQLIFQNGAGLENWFAKLRRNSAPQAKVVTLSQGLKLNTFKEDGETVDDPHLWWNPDNAIFYLNKIRDALSAADPAGKKLYANNARKYVAKLRGLDAYAKKRVAGLPRASRKLVTNHDALGYFARRYGFAMVGEVIPSLGTEQEPSARETARLIDTIRAQGVKAIFTENVVNAKLAQNISRETGVKIAPPLYTDALGPQGGAGDTFLKAFRSNVDTIVNALK